MNRHQSSGRLALGLGLAAFTTVIWGGLPVVTKLMLAPLDVYTLAWVRFLTSGLLLLPILVYRHGVRSLVKAGHMPGLMAICVVGLCGNYLAYMSGLTFISPGVAQVVIQLSPMLVLLGGVVIFHERFSLMQWIGFGVLIVGLLLFFNQRYGDLIGTFGTYAWGVLFVLAAAVLWAVYILAQKQLQTVMPPEAILLVIYFACVWLMLPLAQPVKVMDLSSGYLALLVLLATMTVSSYVCFGLALNHIEASRSGVVVALTPLITMGFSHAVAGYAPGFLEPEPLNVPGWMGAVLVVTGSIFGALGSSGMNEKIASAAFEEYD